MESSNQQPRRGRVPVPPYCLPTTGRKVRCRCSGYVIPRPGESDADAIARCPLPSSGLYRKGVTIMEDLPTCAVCDQPIADDPHSYHAPSCPVVNASATPDDTVALDTAMNECDCPPDAVCHPRCCQVCAALEAAVAG